jgi:hypothetical protein
LTQCGHQFDPKDVQGVGSANTSGFPAAVALAVAADITVVVVGLVRRFVFLEPA